MRIVRNPLEYWAFVSTFYIKPPPNYLSGIRHRMGKWEIGRSWKRTPKV
jgi:hypothetical protein